MKKLRIYLDVCCFNRPFDPQDEIRVRIEAEAKLEIQTRIQKKKIELVWSYMMDFENEANPFDERRNAIGKWRRYAFKDIDASENILAKAKTISKWSKS